MAASLGSNVLQTTFAAISFAGAGYLFQHLNSSGYAEEMERHNKALEDLAKAKEMFYENEIKSRDKAQQLRQELSDANADIQGTNKALDNLKVQGNAQSHTSHTSHGDRGGHGDRRPPELRDFYKPGREMEDYETLVSGGIGMGLEYLLFYLT